MRVSLKFSEEGAETQPDDPYDAFGEDASRHFACAELPVDEDDRHLYDLESLLIALILHLDLERISFEADSVEIYGFEHPSAIAYEAGRGVAQRHPGDEAHIGR